jgi:Putative zinc-finger
MSWENITGEQVQSEHVAPLFPAYINDTLDEQDRMLVRNHLDSCVRCRRDLQSWRVLAELTQTWQDTRLVAPPSPDLLDGVWAKLDSRPTRLARAGLAIRSVYRWGTGCVLLSKSQVRLVPYGIWVACTLATLICLAPLLWPAAASSPDLSMHIAIIQSFLTPVVAALSLAFLYGPETDAGLEITLSTPVSPRMILLSRLLVALCYNFVLSFGVTVLAAALHGGNIALLLSFWVGPMLLLSGLSLALSVGVGTVAATTVTGALWLLHLFVSSISTLPAPVPRDQTPLAALWQTTPATIFIACLLFLVAVIYVPRRAPN